ncbi:coiled-coil domain-containing protein 192-like isoform X2 [Carcharodon carcharias]|uniref:coiled-coil domain-containing protein 192-like isoform X2 n=1 Tax=Carcharodon carcharias TaxID=13397 RepID=UPI001B7E12FC|nr:coiled-coil domain-containing protein 192-like isoform X2 [Carcharodon carcharias]
MGHAASANVKMISVKPEENKRVSNAATLRKAHRIAQANRCVKETPNYLDDLIQGLNFTQIGSIPDSSEVESELQEVKEKARTLMKELAEVEGCKIQLSDQVMWLEEQLEVMRNKLKSAGLYEETLCAKDKYIERLEAENKCVQGQLVQLKHKRIVKNLQIQLAQVKQDAAISVMEARGRIQTLEKENQFTREQKFNNKHFKEGVSSDDIEHHELSVVGGSRVRLVLELSSQLSQQQEKIFFLEKALKEKEAQLSGLETQLLAQPAGGASAHGLLLPNLLAPFNNNTCTTECDQSLGILPFPADNLTSDRSRNGKIVQGESYLKIQGS